MALERLLAALEADARAQADRVLADGRAAAARITQEAEARVGRRREEVLKESGLELRAAAERALGEARRNGRHASLAARDRLIERVFEAACAELGNAIDRPEYRAALPATLAEALEALGDEGVVTVRCAPSLVADIRRAAAGTPAPAVTADPDVRSGFIAATADGVVVIDATLEARLGRLRPLLAIQVLAALERPA